MIVYQNGVNIMQENTNNDITIVTAFFDIGRGDWTEDKGFPHYLKRTTDTYFERFSYLAKLENEMFIFTSKDMIERVADLREDRPTTIFEFDLQNEAIDLRELITLVYAEPGYIKMINPRERKNPEYWSADYVIINLFKSVFARMASIQAKNDMIAWLDFGYCRTEDTLAGLKHWRYPFNPDKIHLFNIKDYVPGTTIHDMIANNDVHITGPCIVASKDNWRRLEFLVMEGVKELLGNFLIDDDQLFLLLSYLAEPDHFELHRVDSNDWFTVFKNFSVR